MNTQLEIRYEVFANAEEAEAVLEEYEVGLANITDAYATTYGTFSYEVREWLMENIENVDVFLSERDSVILISIDPEITKMSQLDFINAYHDAPLGTLDALNCYWEWTLLAHSDFLENGKVDMDALNDMNEVAKMKVTAQTLLWRRLDQIAVELEG